MQKFFVNFLVFSVLWNYSQCVLMGFENGQLYKVTSVATGKYMTVDGQNFESGANVVLKEWNGQDTQKWMALLAPPTTSSFARNVDNQNPSKFYLVPLRQQNGTTLTPKDISLNSLSDTTEVLALNYETANLRTEVRNKLGSSNQQWIPEEAGNGRILIRNFANNQCVKNFDYKLTSLFQKIASFLTQPRQHSKNAFKPLGTFDCSQNEIAEKWIAELA